MSYGAEHARDCCEIQLYGSWVAGKSLQATASILKCTIFTVCSFSPQHSGTMPDLRRTVRQRTSVACHAKGRKVNYVRAPFVPEGPQREQYQRVPSFGALLDTEEPRPDHLSSSSTQHAVAGSRASEPIEWITPRMTNYPSSKELSDSVTSKDEGDMLTAEIRRGIASPAVVLRCAPCRQKTGSTRAVQWQACTTPITLSFS